MGRLLRALIIDDSPADAALLDLELRRGGYEPQCERVDTASSLRAALEKHDWDVILSDYTMPHLDVRNALQVVQELGLDVPYIIVSGTIGEETAAEALRLGAHDFITKGRLARLVPAIEREVREAEIRRERVLERQRTEAERERLIQDLRDAVHTRDVFLAIASHELKTPLTPLLLEVQSLQRIGSRMPENTIPVDKFVNKVRIISDQVARLVRLVNSLIEVTVVNAGPMRLNRDWVDLHALITSVINQQQEICQQSCSTIALEGSNAVGNWDRERLECMVCHLLSNANKFGAGEPIHVAIASDGHIARLTVSDHGIGIPTEVQERIFEKFERAVPEKHYGGFGLGLWTVRQIVEAHGGTIHVESEIGRGSTFIVEIPVVPPIADYAVGREAEMM